MPHRRVDVQTLGADFVAFSGHKMSRPPGSARSGAARSCSSRWSPFILGGDMIRKVTGEQTSWNDLPYKFEGGTPAFAEAVGLGAAIDYLEAAGLEAIEAHEHELTASASSGSRSSRA